MNKDTIYRQDAIKEIHKAIFEFFDICDDDEESPMTYEDEKLLEINKAITLRIKQLPSAQPEPQWIPCSERLPEVSYDYLGNWSSPEVILLMNNEEYIQICNGHFNPVGVFEVIEDDGPAFVGRPVEQVTAWMPLPESYKGE